MQFRWHAARARRSSKMSTSSVWRRIDIVSGIPLGAFFRPSRKAVNTFGDFPISTSFSEAPQLLQVVRVKAHGFEHFGHTLTSL
mmetsp:Transcript_53327/g.98606  ORF Transcript_53327/g.98606 Transcript_53327/m.98606 type:complete len:84 (-) Transcript_53327:443-694(-)